RRHAAPLFVEGAVTILVSPGGQVPYLWLCRVAAWLPYPAYDSRNLSLIYSPVLLKLPVLAASTSLRRSRKAGAARMDAG
ncbi:hypothetical protein, partial [Klebsiella pneumoniae]|uniref:hypothetical protein n=1 Tax=Klebsiella pneumoniae TaxID=573 RepID=UPI00186A5CD3